MHYQYFSNIIGPVNVVLMQQNGGDKDNNQNCLVRFQYAASVQQVLTHSYHIVLNDNVL